MVRHPEYAEDHYKWRTTYEGGQAFIDRYLVKLSRREDDPTFNDRRGMTYCPAYAKLAINKLKNTFYSRMSEIVRLGGPKSYQDACNGKGAGVDQVGSTMNAYLAQEILPELMVMRRVGIWVDREQMSGRLLVNNKAKVPYLYHYRSEDILSWDISFVGGEYNYLSVLLRETHYVRSNGLVIGTKQVYRQAWIGADDGKVHVQFWEPDDEQTNDATKVDAQDKRLGDEIILDLTRIPLVVPSLIESLLTDAANYQIALLNLESTDISYILKANTPIYIEQFDQFSESGYIKTNLPKVVGVQADATETEDLIAGTAAAAKADKGSVVEFGPLTGRRYPKNLDAPSFIAPPTEPLQASMAKQAQMKADIFTLIDLAAANAVGQHASAESKQIDNQGIDSGLSYIGMELEWAEQQIAKIWAEYEGGSPATVKYPTKYALKSRTLRLAEAKDLNALKMTAPSRTFTKEVGKQIARALLKDEIADEVLTTIEGEIDRANYATSDPEVVKTAGELGLSSAVTMSNSLGYDGSTEVPKAKAEHAERLARISASQSAGAARGVPDQGPIVGQNQERKEGNAVDPEKVPAREPGGSNSDS